VLCRQKRTFKSDDEKACKESPGSKVQWFLVDKSGTEHLAAEGQDNHDAANPAGWCFTPCAAADAMRFVGKVRPKRSRHVCYEQSTLLLRRMQDSLNVAVVPSDFGCF
jgi:hypothetical protein